MIRATIAIVWAALATAAFIHYRHDAAMRAPAETFIRTYRIEERRPAYADTIRNAPAADWAADIAADAAIQDVTAPVKLADFDDATRQLWMQSVVHFDEELDAAQNLVLDAIDDRPGWSYHRASLGMLQYLRNLRDVRLGDHPERWFIPLRSALHAAPGEQSFAPFAGAALITAWPFIGEDIRSASPEIFRIALRDPSFTTAYYLPLGDTVGHAQAASMLPDVPRSLRAAIRSEAEVGDVETAAQLQMRWEVAEWKERVVDLGKVEQRWQLDDRTGTLRAAQTWMRLHDEGDFDIPAGRHQLAKLLEWWPDEPGAWRNDPRADLARFFLDGRESDPAVKLLDRNVSALTDVPAPVAARAALFSGDLYRAESIARGADTAGSFEWTRFYVDLAYIRLAQKQPAEATAALAMISPAAREECDVIVARQTIAGPAAPAALAETQVYTPEYWSGRNLAVCIPRSAKAFEVDLDAPTPALATFGFDRGRLGTVSMPAGRTHLRIGVADRPGRHIFSVNLIAGEEVRPAVAVLR